MSLPIYYHILTYYVPQDAQSRGYLIKRLERAGLYLPINQFSLSTRMAIALTGGASPNNVMRYFVRQLVGDNKLGHTFEEAWQIMQKDFKVGPISELCAKYLYIIFQLYPALQRYETLYKLTHKFDNDDLTNIVACLNGHDDRPCISLRQMTNLPCDSGRDELRSKLAINDAQLAWLKTKNTCPKLRKRYLHLMQPTREELIELLTAHTNYGVLYNLNLDEVPDLEHYVIMSIKSAAITIEYGRQFLQKHGPAANVDTFTEIEIITYHLRVFFHSKSPACYYNFLKVLFNNPNIDENTDIDFATLPPSHLTMQLTSDVCASMPLDHLMQLNNLGIVSQASIDGALISNGPFVVNPSIVNNVTINEVIITSLPVALRVLAFYQDREPPLSQSAACRRLIQTHQLCYPPSSPHPDFPYLSNESSTVISQMQYDLGILSGQPIDIWTMGIYFERNLFRVMTQNGFNLKFEHIFEINTFIRFINMMHNFTTHSELLNIILDPLYH